MHVYRAALPGSATVVVVDAVRSILLDLSLTRDEATLVLQDVMPGVHPDAIDHWLDGAYERGPFPFRTRVRVGAITFASAAALMVPVPAHAAVVASAGSVVEEFGESLGLLVEDYDLPGESGPHPVAQPETIGVVEAATRAVQSAAAATVSARGSSAPRKRLVPGRGWWLPSHTMPVQAFGKAHRSPMNRPPVVWRV